MALERSRKVRLAGLFIGLVVIYVVGHTTGLFERVSVKWIRQVVEASGPWGIVVYELVFVAGVMLFIPGMVFIVAGILAWGPIPGAPLALVGALLAIAISFQFYRTVGGGDALSAIDKPFVKRILSQLEERPVRTVALLRLFFWASPPVNTAFALSNIDARAHFVGSVLAMVPVVIVVALIVEGVLGAAG